MTYGISYTVHGWGDEIVTTVEIPPSDVPSGFSSVVRAGDGPVILVPTSALTPVDTTPPEPEPGAWLIGERPFIRQSTEDDTIHIRRWLGAGFHVRTWQEVWDTAGGSGITPRRLVPEPAPVELPWRATSAYGSTLLVDGPDADGEIEVDFGRSTGVQLTVDLAVQMAAALLAAARAAREATP